MKAIIVTGFGSSSPSLRSRTFDPIMSEARRKFPGYDVRLAFLGGMVVERIRSRGMEAESLEGTLDKAVSEGWEEAAVLPALPIAGNQFRQVQSICEGFTDRIPSLLLCDPLLSSRDSMEEFLNVLPEVYPEAFERHSGLVMMGHGRGMEADRSLCQLQHLSNMRGMGAFFTTVTGTPSPEDVAKMMRRANVERAVLAPLMFEAGYHARRDMAGERDSVKSFIISTGFEAECVMRGLGEYPEFRRMFLSRFESMLKRSRRTHGNRRGASERPLFPETISHISSTIWVLYLSVRWYSTSLPDFSVPTRPALRRMVRL